MEKQASSTDLFPTVLVLRNKLPLMKYIVLTDEWEATFDRGKNMRKGPEVGMKLVYCNNRKKIQFGWSRMRAGRVEG